MFWTFFYWDEKQKYFEGFSRDIDSNRLGDRYFPNSILVFGTKYKWWINYLHQIPKIWYSKFSQKGAEYLLLVRMNIDKEKNFLRMKLNANDDIQTSIYHTTVIEKIFYLDRNKIRQTTICHTQKAHRYKRMFKYKYCNKKKINANSIKILKFRRFQFDKVEKEAKCAVHIVIIINFGKKRFFSTHVLPTKSVSLILESQAIYLWL